MKVDLSLVLKLLEAGVAGVAAGVAVHASGGDLTASLVAGATAFVAKLSPSAIVKA